MPRNPVAADACRWQHRDPSRRIAPLEGAHRRVPEPVLHRVAAGDPAAVQEVLDRYGGLVWSLARRMCPSSTDAEDAVQEVFVALWESSDRFDPELGTETTFVAMIARRRLIDRARKASRRPGSAKLVEEIAPSEDRPGSEIRETSEEAKKAQEALKQLSPDQQRVLRLAVYHGLSHDKISQSTGLPLGTVKTHIRRGLIRLRELLEVPGREVKP